MTSSHSKLVIAHRGASGYLPEHTLEAYAYAYALGADYVEPDLVLTRDGVFICLHDIYLDSTTNVATVFPDRKRTDGRYYAIDFDLEEIKTLAVHERLPGRFPKGKSSFQVPTFEEMIELIQGLNQSTERGVGIYPELKQPTWHRAQEARANKPNMEVPFLEMVERHGYRGPDALIFVQCFEKEPLQRLRERGSRLQHVFLVGDDPNSTADLSAEGLSAMRSYADGIGPAKSLLTKDPKLVERFHAAGLVVHPWTFRADDVGPGFSSVDDELESFYFTLGVDGVFTDFPDRALEVLRAHQGAP